MPTKKDLVEAHSFSRRRLITAFVSGAPGGREVEPSRPGRPLIGGLALALLVVAAGAITGFLSKRDAADWKQPGLVISKDRGQPYVLSQGDSGPIQIRPVINITSARLILGSESAPVFVSGKAINAEKIGEPIGIMDAPSNLPESGSLINSGWTACTSGATGLSLSVAAQPTVTQSPLTGFVVTTDGHNYVIAMAAQQATEDPSGYSYQLTGDIGTQDNLLRDLGLGVVADAVPVPSDWLALWPVGGALAWDSFEIPGAGSPVDYAGGSSGVPAKARVGEIVTTPNESVVLTKDGPVRLSPFALAVLRNSAVGGRAPKIHQSAQVNAAHLQVPFDAAHWPEQTLTPDRGEVCGQLIGRAGSPPVVKVVTRPTGVASSVEVGAGQRQAVVDTGGGAFVLSGTWRDIDQGSPYIIDANAVGYPVVGDDAVINLGYAEVEAPVVPDSWIELFDDGVTLSVADAKCPPIRASGKPCQ